MAKIASVKFRTSSVSQKKSGDNLAEVIRKTISSTASAASSIVSANKAIDNRAKQGDQEAINLSKRQVDEANLNMVRRKSEQDWDTLSVEDQRLAITNNFKDINHFFTSKNLDVKNHYDKTFLTHSIPVNGRAQEENEENIAIGFEQETTENIYSITPDITSVLNGAKEIAGSNEAYNRELNIRIWDQQHQAGERKMSTTTSEMWDVLSTGANNDELMKFFYGSKLPEDPERLNNLQATINKYKNSHISGKAKNDSANRKAFEDAYDLEEAKVMARLHNGDVVSGNELLALRTMGGNALDADIFTKRWTDSKSGLNKAIVDNKNVRDVKWGVFNEQIIAKTPYRVNEYSDVDPRYKILNDWQKQVQSDEYEAYKATGSQTNASWLVELAKYTRELPREFKTELNNALLSEDPEVVRNAMSMASGILTDDSKIFLNEENRAIYDYMFAAKKHNGLDVAEITAIKKMRTDPDIKKIATATANRYNLELADDVEIFANDIVDELKYPAMRVAAQKYGAVLVAMGKEEKEYNSAMKEYIDSMIELDGDNVVTKTDKLGSDVITEFMDEKVSESPFYDGGGISAYERDGEIMFNNRGGLPIGTPISIKNIIQFFQKKTVTESIFDDINIRQISENVGIYGAGQQ